MKKPHDAQHDGQLAAIRAAIEPVLAAHAVELCDLAWTTEAGRSGLVLRLTIERPGPEGEVWQPERGFGVTLDDCADVSRAVSAVLDADETITHHYTLEVSSPGLDRPIRGARDFARFRGSLAKVKLARPAPDGQRVLRGALLEAPAGTVAVLVDGKRIEVPEADVAEANLVFEMGAVPKGAGPKAAGPKAAGPRGAAKAGAKSARRPENGRPGPKSASRPSPQSPGPKSAGPQSPGPRGAGKPGAKNVIGGDTPPKRPPPRERQGEGGRGGTPR